MNDYILLHSGYNIPIIGLGTYLTPPEETKRCVLHALKSGYRHIDTARFYFNEEGAGDAVIESAIPRKEIFITTKIWTTDCYYDKAFEAVEESLSKLKTDYIDLVLIHWPPVKEDLKNTWRALEEMVEGGKIRSIGMSNFKEHHLQRVIDIAKIMPSVNQVECHPWFQQKELRKFCLDYDIAVEAWAPLLRAKVFRDKTIKRLSEKYCKTPAQIVLRWDVQEGIITIPKSTHEERIEENFNIFDFELSEEDMECMRAIDKNKRYFRDPDGHGF
jgi:diketogulonate reductase-like aldo/keto reductase